MARVIQKTSLSPDAPYLAELNALPSTLVFIMGCHRSGTSMLHHRYEDLCKDPAGCLSSLSARLNLNLVPRVPPNFVEPRQLNVLPRAIRQYHKKQEALRPYLEHCGYGLYP